MYASDLYVEAKNSEYISAVEMNSLSVCVCVWQEAIRTESGRGCWLKILVYICARLYKYTSTDNGLSLSLLLQVLRNIVGDMDRRCKLALCGNLLEHSI